MHKRIIAATAVAAIGPGAAVSAITGAQASSGKTLTLRLFDKPTATTVTTADGNVISRPPYPQVKPGDVLDVYSLDYPGSHSHHASHYSMITHLNCAFAQGPPTCVSNVAVGSSLLVFKGNKLVGATGNFTGASGRVLSNEVPASNNASDIVVRITRR